jgi:hypothetical protein
MANDVFGRAPSPFEGAFAADASVVQIGGMLAARMLVQNLQINYQQAVNQIFEIGSNNRYYVVGRTNGNLSMGRVVGPIKMQLDVLALLGNVCQGRKEDKNLTFNLGSAACTGVQNQVPNGGAANTEIQIRADACVATGVSYAVQAQDMLINENVSAMFGQLSKL